MEQHPNYSEKEQRRLIRSLFAREVRALGEHTTDPIIRKLAEKILAILVEKEKIEAQSEETIQEQSHGLSQPDNAGGSDGSGGIIKGKQFGIFVAVERTAEEQLSNPKTGFLLNEGDFYIELHLPPVNPDERVISQVGSSLESLAEYLDERDLKPEYIMGITYERLASVSKKWGFTIVSPDLPEEVSNTFERISRLAVREGLKDQPMGRLQLAYQDGNTFLDRFSPHRPA